MSKIRRALIPAAGLGTRFLPASKTVPKELFPLVDKPLILHIVEEAVEAGIEDIILITGRGKGAIEDFFDRSVELEEVLLKAGKEDLLKSITRVRSLANIISLRQKEALGLGHAVLAGAPIIGKEPFAVLLGDEIMVGRPNPTEELCSAFDKTGISTVAVMEVPAEDVTKYGIVQVAKGTTLPFKIENVVEKPSVKMAPSRWALPGRYVFDAKIFEYLKNTKAGKNGEIQLTDAMNGLAKESRLNGLTFTARRFDAGDKFGYLQANIELGLKHPETAERLKNYILSLAGSLK